jgi:ABC-2 type transport system permease protein/sodium transport system permease protein
MSDAAQRAVPSGDSVSRVARLTLKELRETLRDRRTIVTLVLMPLLVYPLLSLAFKQFLLANFQNAAPAQWRIAVASEEETAILGHMLQWGDKLLKEQSESQRTGDAADAPIPGKLAFFTSQDLDASIRRLDVDLAVRVRAKTPESPAAAPTTPEVYEFDLIYRPDSTPSKEVAEYFERRLRAYNDEYLRVRLAELGHSPTLPAVWRMLPLAVEQDETSWMATLVPMILILMTITGAVYPAIDLTAGERERGTLEALMAAPVPRLGLLFAKYLAVLTVAMLTALVNILGMTITVFSTGLGHALFGEQGLSLGAVAMVFGLLVLFAAFFSAVLLCVTSFARSFKEAQAYLIPLMLVSMTPGFLSIIPGLELNAWLSVTPLVNIVLLARDVLAGHAHPLWAFVAIATTWLYAAAALGLAARIFGSDSILYGSQSSWSDLFQRPERLLEQPTMAGGVACLAVIVPLYVVASGTLAQLTSLSMAGQLLAGAIMLLVLFVVVPATMARWQGVEFCGGFQVHAPPVLGVIGAVILGCSLAPLAFELILLSQQFGLATISQEQLAEKAPLVNRLVAQWRELSPVLVLLAIAVVPAVAEEFFFRGYLLGAFRGRLPAWLAILFTALAFGLFHASVGGLIALERVLSSTMLGLVLGWVCWTTRSVLPGMLLHMLNNGFVVALAYWGDGFKSLGWDVEGQRHLPAMWLAAAAGTALVGAAFVYFSRRPSATTLPLPKSPLAVEILPP